MNPPVPIRSLAVLTLLVLVLFGLLSRILVLLVFPALLLIVDDLAGKG